MIVYRRLLKREDIANLEDYEELIYYKDNNIAYVINKMVNNNNYVIRKKKIFNNQLMEEAFFKLPEQIVQSLYKN